jgi:hypothetical protein
VIVKCTTVLVISGRTIRAPKTDWISKFSRGSIKSKASDGPVALISSYGSEADIQRIEVSITYPKQRIVIIHKVWENDDSKPMDPVIDEVMEFLGKHNVGQIQMLDRVLPMSEASTGKCHHCGESMVRVPWKSD